MKPLCGKYSPECEGKFSTALCALSQKPQVRCPLIDLEAVEK